MKKIFFFSLLFVITTGCKSKQDKNPERKKVSASELPGESVYQFSAEWQNQDGETIQLKDLTGPVQVTAMFYAGCHNACPRIVADMKRIEEKIPAEYAGKVKYLLISFDPANDNPAKLKSFAKDNQLSPENWTLLTGKEADVTEFANIMDMRIKKNSDGQYDHSNFIHILSREGVVIFRQEGMNTDVSPLVETITKASGG